MRKCESYCSFRSTSAEQRAALEEVFQGMDVDDSRGVDLAEFVAFMRQRWPTS